jgi:hypothetical protein
MPWRRSRTASALSRIRRSSHNDRCRQKDKKITSKNLLRYYQWETRRRGKHLTPSLAA